MHPDFLVQFCSNLPSLGAETLEAAIPIPLEASDSRFPKSLEMLDHISYTETSKVPLAWCPIPLYLWYPRPVPGLNPRLTTVPRKCTQTGSP